MPPFRLDPDKYPNRAKIQFLTSAAMPSQIHKACLATGTPSNTVYIQRAVCAALSVDLGIPLQELLDNLPTWRQTPSLRGVVYEIPRRPGPGNTIEEVR